MKKLTSTLALMFVALFSTTAAAQTPTFNFRASMAAVVAQAAKTTPAKKYLNLGADPQDKNRQPIAGKEEVVIIDDDICDPAWGSGSGKTSNGCYPAHTAIIRDIVTHFATAAFVCGNIPRDKHVANGKVVPTTELPALQNTIQVTGIPKTLELDVKGIPTDTTTHVDGKVEVDVHHSGTVKVENSGVVNTGGQNGSLLKSLKFWGPVVGAVVVGAVVANHGIMNQSVTIYR